jgi:hypothetical protein
MITFTARCGLEPLLLIPSLTFLLLAQLSQSTPCCTPVGEDVNLAYNVTENWFYVPCNNVAEVSICCAIGLGRKGSAVDEASAPARARARARWFTHGGWWYGRWVGWVAESGGAGGRAIAQANEAPPGPAT